MVHCPSDCINSGQTSNEGLVCQSPTNILTTPTNKPLILSVVLIPHRLRRDDDATIGALELGVGLFGYVLTSQVVASPQVCQDMMFVVGNTGVASSSHDLDCLDNCVTLTDDVGIGDNHYLSRTLIDTLIPNGGEVEDFVTRVESCWSDTEVTLPPSRHGNL